MSQTASDTPAVTVTTPRFVAPGDTPDISEECLSRMTATRERVSKLVDDRAAAIEREALDPAFCLPDANWGPDAANDFCEAYRHLRGGDRTVLNRLRFWSQVFTGFQVMTLRDGAGLHSVNAVPADHDDWLRRTFREPDQWVDHWRRLTDGLPRAYRISPPWMLGETGWDVEGILVNRDTVSYQERICLLHAAGVLARLRKAKAPRILEIGGGYGGLCRAILAIVPHARYVICDLPESLMFSGLYLAATHGVPEVIARPVPGLQAAISLIPNYHFHYLANTRFDLVINTMSMSEMTEYQVAHYAAAIARMLAAGGVFFEQNRDNEPIGFTDAQKVIARSFGSKETLSLAFPAFHGTANLWTSGGRMQGLMKRLSGLFHAEPARA